MGVICRSQDGIVFFHLQLYKINLGENIQQALCGIWSDSRTVILFLAMKPQINEFVALLAQLIFHYIIENETAWIARDENVLLLLLRGPVSCLLAAASGEKQSVQHDLFLL